MKIGFITADLNHHHGWAHYSLELIQALHRANQPLTVVASHNTAAAIDCHPILPALVPRERALLPKLFAKSGEVKRLLHDCDIIHCTVEPFAPLATWTRSKRPFIQGGVGSYLNLDGWQRPPLTWLYRHSIGQSRLVCISHYSAKIARQQFPNAPVDVIPLGIDPARFETLPPLSEPKPPQLIITAGGVKYRKGTLPLVRAMAKVRERFPTVKCIVLGKIPQDDYSHEVQATIAALNLEDCVELRGFVSDEQLRAWYGAADVFVLPSMNKAWMFEGYGLVHMEASAAGLPVIGTRGCGVEDAIDDGITGLLVSQQNIDNELPQAIIQLLENPAQRAKMGIAGRQRAQSQTWDHVAQQLLAVYEKVL